MPLHGYRKAFIGAFQRLNGVVFGVARRHAKMFAHYRGSLMMARIDSYRFLAEDHGQLSMRFDRYLMRGLALIFWPPHVMIRCVQVLDERAAMGHIEDLKTTADSKQRNVRNQRVGDERQFNLVAFVVRLFRLFISDCAIAGGIHVRTAHQQDAVAAFYRCRITGKSQHGLNANFAQRGLVRFGGVKLSINQ